jgi:PKD repeat protein
MFTGTLDAIGAVHATSMSVYPKVSFVAILPNGQSTVPYTQTNVMSTGTAPFVVAGSGVPAGMTLSTDGLLSGTPVSSGTFTLGVVATDAKGNSAVGSLTLLVTPAPVVVVPVTFAATLANGQVGTAYPVSNLVTNGVAPFVVTASGVPAGLAVSTAGNISGTPTTAGTYTVALSATDAAGTLGTGSITIVVSPAPIPVAFTAALSGGQVGKLFTPANLVNTGVAPFVVTASGVPAGMNVSAAGLLSGTPTTAGTYSIALSAKDSVGTVGSGLVTLVVAPAPVVVPVPYTATAVKVEGKGLTASYSDATKTITLAGGLALRLTSASQIHINDRATLSSVGVLAQYKGVKNTDGSVSVTSLELN